eukprot:GHVL01009375.1.p3 GENE.GHVL01009375.1~~GHVL01009375.1.p3  ORF type:complete len:119 (-),score=15.89 GHVL01009375.1:260-616(-)
MLSQRSFLGGVFRTVTYLWHDGSSRLERTGVGHVWFSVAEWISPAVPTKRLVLGAGFLGETASGLDAEVSLLGQTLSAPVDDASVLGMIISVLVCEAGVLGQIVSVPVVAASLSGRLA